MAVAARADAHRVPIDEPLPDGMPDCDYSDAFEISLPDADPRTPEEWARDALENSPPALRRFIVVAHRYVLGLRLGPLGDPGRVLGWEVVESDDDLVRLTATSPLATAMLVGRRLEGSRMRLTTFLCYRRPALARPIWAAVGPAHRRIAPYLLNRAARRHSR
ncbi:MAG: hypothetical protein QOI15_1217 [Pseudonocardiales bacterium]|nr:hypothetical protein [Pseudonocardiales bacterium]